MRCSAHNMAQSELLQNVHLRIMDLSPSRTGLLAQTLSRSPGSRAHCLLTCLDSSTTPSPAANREITRPADVAFPRQKRVGTRLHVFGAQLSCPPALCLRFAAIPHGISGKTRGRNRVASPFP